MDTPVLTDKTQFPTDEIIFSHLGKRKALWIVAFDSIAKEYPELSKEWRYYNDGKSWLMKVRRKSKTIFWLSVRDNSFRTAFYFTDKAEKAIEESTLSEKLKQQFRERNRSSKINGIRIVVATKKDISDLKKLIDLKLRLT
jgi:hypothetical protein